MGGESRRSSEESDSLQKAVIRYADGRVAKAFLPPAAESTFLSPNPGVLTLHDVDGMELEVEAKEIKAVFLVKSFEGDPNYVEFKNFPERPGDAGLWVRVDFTDHESLEGVAPNVLATFSDPIFFMTPPDPQSNNHAVMVSKVSLTNMKVLGFEAEN